MNRRGLFSPPLCVIFCFWCSGRPETSAATSADSFQLFLIRSGEGKKEKKCTHKKNHLFFFWFLAPVPIAGCWTGEVYWALFKDSNLLASQTTKPPSSAPAGNGDYLDNKLKLDQKSWSRGGAEYWGSLAMCRENKPQLPSFFIARDKDGLFIKHHSLASSSLCRRDLGLVGYLQPWSKRPFPFN